MKKLWIRWAIACLLLGCLLGAAAWAGLGASDDKHHQALGASLATTAIVMGLTVALLEWAAHSDTNPDRKEFGFLLVILGADGRISTSKTVVFLWTLTFAAALTLLAAEVCWGGLTVEQAFGAGASWDGYFLLLGGPFAAAVLAKGITASRVADNPTAKSSTSDRSNNALPTTSVGGEAKIADVVTDDTGSTDLVDTQYTIFSFVAIAYFIGAMTANVLTYARDSANTDVIGLPEIPAALLGLTSLAALTYVGNKTVATQGIRTVSLNPNPATTGVPVTATIANLPANAAKGTVYIVCTKDGAKEQTGVTSVDRDKGTVSFNAPINAGDYQVVVVADGLATPPLTLKVE